MQGRTAWRAVLCKKQLRDADNLRTPTTSLSRYRIDEAISIVLERRPGALMLRS